MVGSGSKSALSELSRTPQLLVAKNNREHGCQFQADYEPKQPLKCHVKCRHSVLKACENEQNDRSLSLPYRKTKPGEEQPERWGKVRDDYAAPGFFATWYDVVGVLTKTLFVRAERQTLSVQAEVFLAPSYGPLFPILVALQTWRLIESCFASRIYTLGLRDLQFAPGYIASLRVREGQRFNPLVVEPVEKKRIARGLLRGIDDGVWSQEGGGPSNVTTT
ncbi:hypothetical protein M0657_004608 [Pyricularia oryzae]|nr:hypothetical protein M0657_004608 [Pyricularia oryzae]KAI7926249.1 hypothetical protein M9X92_002839 [Pyricularia oryzae]